MLQNDIIENAQLPFSFFIIFLDLKDLKFLLILLKI